MAAVKIDTGPIEATQLLSSVPREKWPLLLSERRSFAKVRLPYDCRELLRFVDEAREMYGPLGYKNVEDLVRRGLELDPDLVIWALEGLKSIKPGEEAPFLEMVERGKLGKRGAPKGNSRASKNRVDSIKSDLDSASGSGGTSKSYRLARLERDHPKIREAYDAGEFKSVAAAWRAAGLEKPKNPVQEALRWVGKMDADQLKYFFDRIKQYRRSL